MTVTYYELKKIQRKQAREELKRIEAILHPCPKINGLDILHEHKGQKITFSAWKGDDPANTRRAEYDRLYILQWGGDDFYSTHADALKWLTGAE